MAYLGPWLLLTASAAGVVLAVLFGTVGPQNVFQWLAFSTPLWLLIPGLLAALAALAWGLLLGYRRFSRASQAVKVAGMDSGSEVRTPCPCVPLSAQCCL